VTLEKNLMSQASPDEKDSTYFGRISSKIGVLKTGNLTSILRWLKNSKAKKKKPADCIS